ncbi:hypothetical protein [Magnetospirillum molischianum]|uniref:Uncharacterized protein n=1 Tax=Magnetospirillum molischianum DSM 120 TaxID=1150626 RepID=H8FPJ5_MAGML|nr:hypothetical protein [Magnetospirillum molischianum]CCG40283.1 conserved hypothetical protein [Magnetospirillum molischianum DSM 120]
MALSTKQVSAISVSGVAAATARIGSGGRNVASTSREDVERLDYAHQTGLGDETFLRYQQEANVSPDGGRQRDRQNPPLWRSEFSRFFLSDSAIDDDDSSNSLPPLFLDQVLRGIGSYEQSIRITSPHTVRPGSVMNYLF